MPTPNVGTLVGSAIRPLDDAMQIASAFAFEINGGHHQVATITERNNIMVQRRQWGMLCTVYNDSTAANNATYQLKYGYSSVNTMDNSNWVVFGGGVSGAGSGSGAGNWADPVISVSTSSPNYPEDGARYLVGRSSVSSLTGAFSNLTNTAYSGNLVGGFIAEYKSALGNWITTLPSNGMTLRVNNDDNAFYRYEGTYSTGQWYKERVNQVRTLAASSVNKADYIITTGDYFTYSTEAVYLVQFGTANSGGTCSLNINSLGVKDMKKQTASGIVDLDSNDLIPSAIYHLIYDGTYFRVNPIGAASSSGGGGAALKYKIVEDERIVVPAYSEYLLYGDLEVNGTLDISSTGKVVIINGALNVNGGTVSNSGNIHLITFATSSVSVPSSGLQKYTELVSMSAGVTYSISHGLNTLSPVVNIWNEDNGELVIVDVFRKNANVIDIYSTETISNVRFVAIG